MKVHSCAYTGIHPVVVVGLYVPSVQTIRSLGPRFEYCMISIRNQHLQSTIQFHTSDVILITLGASFVEVG